MRKRTMLLTASGAGCVAASAGLAFGAALLLGRRREGFESKTVLITGSSRGLGLAMAEEFGRKGARLVLTARDPEELERGRRLLLSRGAVPDEEHVLALPCDLTDEGQTRELVRRATERFGQIDVLVNNAGIITVGPVENQPLSAFKEAIESNYYTMLHATLAVLPQMLARRKGSIVNITSIGGKMAVAHLLPYSASKFAAVGFSQGLHAELRQKGIRVTTVCPGLMRTGSPVQALFTGHAEREYRWFSLGAGLPGVAANAASAARKIVRATETGATEITITPQAFVAARLAQAVPECTARAMSLVNRFVLPGPADGDSNTPVPGRNVRQKEITPLIHFGERAMHRYNQGT